MQLPRRRPGRLSSGQAIGLFVYVRNLMLMTKRPAENPQARCGPRNEGILHPLSPERLARKSGSLAKGRQLLQVHAPSRRSTASPTFDAPHERLADESSPRAPAASSRWTSGLGYGFHFRSRRGRLVEFDTRSRQTCVFDICLWKCLRSRLLIPIKSAPNASRRGRWALIVKFRQHCHAK